MNIEVAYALPDQQMVIPLRVSAGTTMYEAVVQSDIVSHFPGLDLAHASMGIFGKIEKSPRSRVLADGERVEIYRPLLTDPKEARKARAAKVRAEKL